VSTDDLELAGRFLAALASAAKSGDRDPLYAFLAPDVEWVTSQREVRGIEEAREQLSWIRPPDNLDIEFSEPALIDLGDGRIATEVHQTYRMSETSDFAYARDRRIELTIRDGKVARYEMRVVG
jgi:ketosteroid isomerase-like protein